MPGGRISSMWRSKRADAAIDTIRQAVATIVVRRREVIRRFSGMRSSCRSFQIPALEDQDRTAECHYRVKDCVKRVLEDELSSDGLLMSDCTDHVERGKV